MVLSKERAVGPNTAAVNENNSRFDGKYSLLSPVVDWTKF
jgi:hypothetical protein